MKPTTKTRVLLVLSVLLGTGCMSTDEARAEFCANADLERRQALCDEVPTKEDPLSDGGTDGGTTDGGTTDGGTSDCTDSTQCTTPPGECYETQGACVSRRCAYVPKTTGTACSTTPAAQCINSTGTCSNGTCITPSKPKGTPCSDGNACTSGDSCDGASSCAGTPIACNSPPNQCYQATGTCNPSTGSCQYVPKPAGSACNDGNVCTSGDSCDGNGRCMTGGTAVVCTSRSLECMETIGSCNPQTGCEDAYQYKCLQGQYCERGQCCSGTNVSSHTSSPPPCLEPAPQ